MQKLKKDTKLLSMCSTRIRPELAAKMVDSFNETKSEGTEIVLYVWKDDPFVETYKKLLKGENVIYGKKRFMIDVLNYISTEVYPGIDYYQNICDDHLYLVKGWDKLYLEPLEKNNGWGIAYCKGVNAKHNPTAEIISGKIVRALGYYFYPEFRQFGGEPFIVEIGEAFGFFYYIEGDIIAHNCVGIGAMEPDANHQFIYGEDVPHGLDAMDKWRKTRKEIDLLKIRKAQNE